MPVRKEELERAMEVIVDAAMEIETQDNLATADPIFMVQERRETYNDISGEETAEYWHNIQPFFTNKAAERYIRENKHNMTRARIYVASAYRNREWIAIRTMLRSMYEKAGE